MLYHNYICDGYINESKWCRWNNIIPILLIYYYPERMAFSVNLLRRRRFCLLVNLFNHSNPIDLLAGWYLLRWLAIWHIISVNVHLWSFKQIYILVETIRRTRKVVNTDILALRFDALKEEKMNCEVCVDKNPSASACMVWGINCELWTVSLAISRQSPRSSAIPLLFGWINQLGKTVLYQYTRAKQSSFKALLG